MKSYKFDKLSKKAKQNAIDNIRDGEGYLNYDWWDFTYIDAEEIGLKITGFDVGRGQKIYGELTQSMEEVCKDIIANHGEQGRTYKTAKRYLEKYRVMYITAKLIGTEEADELLEEQETELSEMFTKEILRDYWQMLYDEYQYQYTDEAVQEHIEANEYDFDIDGDQIVIKKRRRVAA